jgi:hypothetical protein
VRITVSCREERGGVIRDEYVLGADGRKLVFPAVKAAINYLADRNWTIEDLRKLEFNAEEAKR